MLSRKRIGLAVVVSVMVLASIAQSVLAYDWNAPSNWFTAEYQLTMHYCGPASARMYLNYVKSKYGLIFTVPSQSSLNTYGHSKNISKDPDVDPRGEAWNLYHYTPAGYYYDDWIYDNAHSGVDGGAWAIAFYQEPIVVATYAGAHFMVLRGVTADSDPKTNYPNANISYVYVADPWNPNWGQIFPGYYALGTNNHIAYSTWTGSYFTKFTYHSENGAQWTNHWVTIERDSRAAAPTTRHGTTINANASALNAPALKQPVDKGIGGINTPLLPTDPKAVQGELLRIIDQSAEIGALPQAVAEEAQQPKPIRNDSDVIAIATRTIDLVGLNKKPGFGPALQGAVAGAPIFINSISPDFPDYYLVPFRQGKNVTAVVMVGVKDGQGFYMGSTYTNLPVVDYPFVSKDKAMATARPQLGTLAATARLVWKPSQESMEPYYPIWEVSTNLGSFYVDHTEQVRTQLSEP